ncbi:MAG: hypothetical protein LBK46_03835 [Oscillospiraceae bacterium]|jgi:hypothetical protein|nr:hypothetical protein [Oscillospiraceae bacterium]
MRNDNSYRYEQAHDATLRESMSGGALVKVIKFNDEDGTVDVQPIAKRNVNGVYEDRPPILHVPISNPSGTGFTCRQQFKKGDVGSMLFFDHDMDNPYAAGDKAQPNTPRVHQGGDGVFMGSVPAGGKPHSLLPPGTYGFGVDDSNYLVIYPDGHIEIISEQPVTVKSDLDVIVEAGTAASVKAGVSASVEAPEITLTGNVTIDGNLAVSGNTDIGGNLNVAGTITPWPTV